jgi:hypothetical protein
VEPVERKGRGIDAAIAAVAALVFSLYPLTSYDLWWHLASGREIWRRKGIPFSDPFSFASDRGLWIDHGWLFQLIAFAFESAGGALLLQLVQVLLVFGTAFIVARELRRDEVPLSLSVLVIAFAFALAKPRLTLRPELVTLFLLALFLSWLRSLDRGERQKPVALALLALLWINLHPGVLLAGMILTIWCALSVTQAALKRDRLREHFVSAAVLLLAFTLPLFLNPYGKEGVLFAFQLRSAVDQGTFVNPEWLPATFDRLPLLFIGLPLTAGLFIYAAFRRRGMAPDSWWRAITLAVLAFLAFRYQRNVGVFAVGLPLLSGPELAEVAVRMRRPMSRLAGALALVLVVYSFFTFVPPGFGINRNEVAVDATEFIARSGLRGRGFNQARFGGFLIWRLYPEHRVLIDGRNEVYTALLPRLIDALGDQRKWMRFLSVERIEWAIVGYGNPVEMVAFVGADGTVRTEARPFALNRFPPSQWALVYWDDTAMVLVRRDGVNASLASTAPRYLWPENIPFAVEQLRQGRWPAREVAAELEQAARERPGVERLWRLVEAVRAAK